MYNQRTIFCYIVENTDGLSPYNGKVLVNTDKLLYIKIVLHKKLRKEYISEYQQLSDPKFFTVTNAPAKVLFIDYSVLKIIFY